MNLPELMTTKDISGLLGVCHRHCVDRIIKRPDFPRPAPSRRPASCTPASWLWPNAASQPAPPERSDQQPFPNHPERKA